MQPNNLVVTSASLSALVLLVLLCWWPQLFPRLQQLALAAVSVVDSAAAEQREVDFADLAKRVTSDVMGSILLGLDFGGMSMRWVGGGPYDLARCCSWWHVVGRWVGDPMAGLAAAASGMSN
jgi:hypothetical protein